MKIAWISYGFLEYSSLHINAMNEHHDVLAVLPEPDRDDEQYSLRPSVEQFLFKKPRLRQPFQQRRSIQTIMEAVYDFKPDVVHFQQAHLWFNFSLHRIQKDFPLVLTIHDPRHHSGDLESKKTPQWVMDMGFRRADHVIVHGDKLAGTVSSLLNMERSRIHVIPHVAMGNMSDVGQLKNIETDPNMILFFGRIWDYKGLKYLIEAEPIISREFPDVKIVIAGQGDDFEKYRSQMVNPDRFVVDNDWISDEDRAEYFSRAAMVVLPYTDATQSGVVPVAYNFRKPVVATNVGALPDCVTHGETGLLVPPKDPSALAEAILQMLRNPTLARKMGQAGHDWVSQEGSPESVAEKHIQAYKKSVIYRAQLLDSSGVMAGSSIGDSGSSPSGMMKNRKRLS
jgi:glycosyltransferase involved in cell wall biosynthesis